MAPKKAKPDFDWENFARILARQYLRSRRMASRLNEAGEQLDHLYNLASAIADAKQEYREGENQLNEMIGAIPKTVK